MIKVLLRLSVCLILIEAIVAKYGKWTLQRGGCPRLTKDYRPACFEDGKTRDECDEGKIKCRGECPCPTVCQRLCRHRHGWDFAPVCGEDGQSYFHSCNAKCEKVKIKCEGLCPCSKTLTSQREGCPRRTKDFQFACFEDGITRDRCSSGKLKCEGPCPCPTSCKGLCERLKYDPVCGENGKTYDNLCSADCEKVKIKCEGKCPCPKTWTSQREGCPRGIKDFRPACFEDGSTRDRCANLKMKCEGRCPCPTSCKGLCERSHWWDQDPVCGENGQTYHNSCNAKCEKVKIKCKGKCPCSKKLYPIIGNRGTNSKY